jgi:hypothetical protein
MGFFDDLQAERALRQQQAPTINALKPSGEILEGLQTLGFTAPFVGNVALRTEAQATAFWQAEPTTRNEVPLLVATYRMRTGPELGAGWSYGIIGLDELTAASNPTELILDVAQFTQTPDGTSQQLKHILPALLDVAGASN